MKWVKLNNISIPIIAIGGISMEDIAPILKTGISGIAVSGLLSKQRNNVDLKNTVSSIQKMLATQFTAKRIISID